VTPQQLKKALVAAGFEVFRTLGEDVVLADRVRENLIMDSGVRLGLSGEGLKVKIVLRAQLADFPNEAEAELFARVRLLGQGVIAKGFAEISANATAVKDPADTERVLDTFFEVTFAKEAADVAAALPDLRFAMGLDKAVRR
jgi:hypothetical protein